MTRTRHHDAVIVGGGISGTALLFLLARYTDLERIALVEKHATLASVNSHGRNNSQTLHMGDIETNYTLDKARKVQAAARLVTRYVHRFAPDDAILHRYPKMVLAVGEAQCARLAARFEEFSPAFPRLEKLEATDIARIEPAVMEGRREPVLALGMEADECAADFQRLAASFARQAQESGGRHVTLHLDTRVRAIREDGGGFRLDTSAGPLAARSVVVSAGGHSLLFAQRMGHGQDYACLPVAGSFYFAPQVLRGKVYTVQNEKLPFAAIHGDPDLLVPGKTRFGPTALVLPVLERYNPATAADFLRVFRLDRDVLATLGGLLREPEIRAYLLRNFLYEVPGIRRPLFAREVRRIVPGLRARDLRFARRVGGIRPVMIDKRRRRLHLGEAKVAPGNGIIFNMTPSPGATSCLQNALGDLRAVADFLGAGVDEAALRQELGDGG